MASVGVLERIEEAGRIVRDVVASIDAGTVSGADAERLISALGAVSKSADAGVAKLARRLEETARWKHAQAPSAEALLGKLTGGSAADGKRLLETSKRLDGLAETKEAMEQGRLSVEQAAQIAAAAGELADAGRAGEAEAVEAELLGVAAGGNFGSLRSAAERARQAARDAEAQREHLRKTRFFRKRRFDDGGVGGTFKLEPGVAAEVYAILDAEADRQFRLARAEGRRDGHDAYAADALVEVVTQGSGAGGAESGGASGSGVVGDAVGRGDTPDDARTRDGHPGGNDTADHSSGGAAEPTAGEGRTPELVETPGSGPAGAGGTARRVEIVGRVDLAALYRGYPMVGELCEIVGVGPVPVDVLRDLLGEALLTLVLTDGVDVMNVTCTGRRGSKELRTAVAERDGWVCTECGFPAGLEGDHTEPWALDRRTRYAAFGNKCRRCHKIKTAREAPVTIRAGRDRADAERLVRARFEALVAETRAAGRQQATSGRAPPGTG